MKALGLIVEYNPFHNGHKLHLEKSKEISKADLAIAVMSGNFLQRGEPAILDKFKRAEIALLNGVDLIIELPSFYSTQSAEIFAKGAVSILNDIGIDELIFGSESGDIGELEFMADLQLERKDELDEIINFEIKKGISYPNAFNIAVEKLTGKKDVLSPNNILGIEYIKAIKKIKSKIEYKTIKREKAGYYTGDLEDDIASASVIRKEILSGNIGNIKNVVSKKTYDYIVEEKELIADFKDYYEIIRYKIIDSKERLLEIQDMEEGFENRLYENAIKHKDFLEFYNAVISKRFTNSRLNRILNHILISLTKEITEDALESVPYIRVLAFNSNGQKFLNKIKKNENIELISDTKYIKKKLSERAYKYFDYELKTSYIYGLAKFYNERKVPIIMR